MLLFAVVIVVLVGSMEVSTETTTHHPHHHHPHHNTTGGHNIHHGITFLYDHVAKVFLAKTHNMCYLHNLSDTEKANIETPTGLKDVELTVFQLIGSSSDKVINKHDVTSLDNTVRHFCAHVSTVHEV